MNAKEQEWQAMSLSQKCYALAAAGFVLLLILVGALFVALVFWGVFIGSDDPLPADVRTEQAAAPTVEPPPKRVPLDLPAARQLAETTLDTMESAYPSLLDAIRLQDRRGKHVFVDQPLLEVVRRWPTMIHERDATDHFDACGWAAVQLQSLAAGAIGDQTTGTLKSMRETEAQYWRGVEQCKALIALPDAEILRRAAGRECLTSYDIDPNTGELVAVPKPAHCPSKSAR